MTRIRRNLNFRSPVPSLSHSLGIPLGRSAACQFMTGEAGRPATHAQVGPAGPRAKRQSWRASRHCRLSCHCCEVVPTWQLRLVLTRAAVLILPLKNGADPPPRPLPLATVEMGVSASPASESQRDVMQGRASAVTRRRGAALLCRGPEAGPALGQAMGPWWFR